MTMSRLDWGALAIFLLAPVQVDAQESVETKVRALEETVQLLERRVAFLEAEIREQSAPASVPAGKGNWRKLRNGMSEGEVESLLGSPSKVNANQAFFIWYYDYPSGGDVRFDGRSRKVEAWSEP